VFFQVPVASQVCGCSPLHVMAFGVQTPVQAPVLAEQTYWQGVPLLCQVPVASQSCGCSPLHVFDAGAQTPVQAPPLHRY
jgi:hypothetical protein